MDTIFIRELRLQAWVGLYEHEKIAPQTIEIDVEFGVPGDAVFRSGRVLDTIDYSQVVVRLRALLEKEHFVLIETLAERIARLIIGDFGSPKVTVSVTKLGVVKGAGRVGVTIERTASR